ncbi:MAG: arabinan endo-1,5-alpha-L-arabinosidase, partial [Lachnospiraceae bacterium]|nr:arabinan endo-1,5-alpha-L-arabinosidase [Lachnospiraceae bacterium]
YKTSKETVSETGYAVDEIAGDYYFVDQGSAIDSKVAQPLMIRLNKDGSITGAFSGNWSIKDGSYQMHITVDGKDFSGVFCKQKDMTGVEVMTFSAVGGLESVYGVKY